MELKKLLKMTAEVIPVVMGALGTPPRHSKERWGKIEIETKMVNLMKTAIIYSARNVQKRSWLVGSLFETIPQE